jgi:hypothetical protein
MPVCLTPCCGTILLNLEAVEADALLKEAVEADALLKETVEADAPLNP